MEILKSRFRSFPLYQWAALKYRNAEKLRLYHREARRLAQIRPGDHSIEELLTIQSPIFSSNQKVEEITQLLRLLDDKKPKTVLEIGTFRGGTLFHFSRVSDPRAHIVSLDYHYPTPEHLHALPKLAWRGQKIHCIQADSHSFDTVTRIRGLFRERTIDFLFIDGDHSYEGVKKDYDLYAPLVSGGGIIAFHDIVPDFETRHGIKTKAYTGGVPDFWQELKTTHPGAIELIADAQQDGYGIGIIRK